eukprot:7376544-Prymnesium_polylepis.2
MVRRLVGGELAWRPDTGETTRRAEPNQMWGCLSVGRAAELERCSWGISDACAIDGLALGGLVGPGGGVHQVDCRALVGRIAAGGTRARARRDVTCASWRPGLHVLESRLTRQR